MQPDIKHLRVDLFTDADFTGLFATEDDQDPISVKTRTGLLLNFGGVPIFLSSKLQSEISLSSLEAEYIVLSQGMRELAFARNLVQEFGKQ